MQWWAAWYPGAEPGGGDVAQRTFGAHRARWSEISARIASLVLAFVFQIGSGLDSADPVGFVQLMLWTAGLTTVFWLVVTYLTAPVSQAPLESFHRRVRPGGIGWRRVAVGMGIGPEPIGGGARSEHTGAEELSLT